MFFETEKIDGSKLLRDVQFDWNINKYIFWGGGVGGVGGTCLHLSIDRKKRRNEIQWLKSSFNDQNSSILENETLNHKEIIILFNLDGYRIIRELIILKLQTLGHLSPMKIIPTESNLK